jgi:hypothetical protein
MTMARKKIDKTFLCLDCKIDTAELDEYYLVRDEVWREANPQGDGMLCISCLEKRLGRELTHDDFAFVPLNLIALFRGSDLLRERMDAAGLITHSLADMSLGDLSFGIANAVVTHQEKIEAAMNRGKEKLQ